MLVIIMMISYEQFQFINLIYRIFFIFIGISSAFLINALVFPPNHQKLLYNLLTSAQEKTSFLLRVIPNKTMKVRELKNYKDELTKKIKEVDDYLDVIIDEKTGRLIQYGLTL